MKKLFALALAVLVIFTIAGCSAKNDSDRPLLDLSGKAVKEIKISTLPESDNYKRNITSSEEILKIVNYINDMHLTNDFSENPNEYNGMTIAIQFCLEDGSALNVYSLGNMFLRVNNEPWLRVKYDEAEALEEMVLQ